jgi:hypothetical protein
MAGPEPSTRPRTEPASRQASGAPETLSESEALDLAVYAAISATPTPGLDRFNAALSRAADGSKLWIAAAALLAASGDRGRRAAVDGLASIAVTSGTVNLVLKPKWHPRRPDRVAHRGRSPARSTCALHVVPQRARGVGVRVRLGRRARDADRGSPARGGSRTVAYSRVDTGVH